MPDSSLRYRVVFSINEAAPAGEVNRSLEKVARYLNLLAAGGIRPDAGDIVAVVHGPATPIVAINPDNPNLALIAALQEAGVTVAICSQAMNRAELSADDLAPGVRVDAAAITTLTNLQLRGWAVVRSEEHTSELQSLMRNSYDGICLKKKQTDRSER